MQRLLIYCLLLLLVSCKSKEEKAQPKENWVLTNRKVYTDKLNAFGLPDTTYTKSYSYENSNIKDSSEMFSVHKYDDERRLISRSFFLVRKDGSPFLQSQSRMTYSGKYLANMIDETNGILTKDEKYTYDTSGKMVKSVIIRMKDFENILLKDARDLQKETLLNQGYDTLHITYKYEGNKIAGGDMADNRGNLIRRDVNLYSGNSPFSSYNLGPKGDTLQHIRYSQVGDKLTSQIENNDFVIVTSTQSGYPTGKITFDKKKNEKLKQDWGYANGRLTEERFYVDQQKK
jgi:hypothetical protein